MVGCDGLTCLENKRRRHSVKTDMKRHDMYPLLSVLRMLLYLLLCFYNLKVKKIKV